MNKHLTAWQREFIDQYGASDAQKSLLVASPGSGKTVTTLIAARTKLKERKISHIVVVSDRKEIRTQWCNIAANIGISLSKSLKSTEKGSAVTFQYLSKKDHLDELEKIASNMDSLIIFDEVYRYLSKAEEISEVIASANSKSKFLYLSSTPVTASRFDWTHSMGFGREFLFQPKIIRLPDSKTEIRKHSPSLSLLDKFQSRILMLDDLSWRDFEVLISRLLESDGYDIELMKGTKDGGVDIVAVKDMKEAGLYKAVWQAKKYKVANKIGISTIRELADVRNEFGASKGILVTSSFLTSGALKRIYRDRYTLGKVDRDDLHEWINRKLFL